MEKFDFSKMYVGYLPTQERREYDEKLRKYAEYFQRRLEAVNDRGAMDRIADSLPSGRKRKKRRDEQFQSEMKKYGELVKRIVSRTQQEYVSKNDNAGDMSEALKKNTAISQMTKNWLN